jgi:thioredoxin reductase (NADPH)
MIQTDIIIVGSGPVGLFAVFEAGLLQMRCHLVDALPIPGGQLSEIYPKKPIYDIPGYPSILAGELVDRLMEQIAPFKPGFTLGEKAEHLTRLEDGSWLLETDAGTQMKAPVVAIAAGLGAFEPRKPPISNIEDYERKGVAYMIKEPEMYRGEKVVIAGGGDSALDWSIVLSEIAEEVVLVHRRSAFRAAPDSVEKAMDLAKAGKIKLVTEAQVVGLGGEDRLSFVEIEYNDGTRAELPTAHFIPLFGLIPKLGVLAEWGLELEENGVRVNTFDYSTNLPGVFAIGDINTYPGKLKLILCGFHEATLMCQSAFRIINPEKKLSLKYTTVQGVKGFETANT